VRRLLSNGAFYRQAKVLRGYGIDIAEPLANASKFTSVIKVIEISPVSAAPDWYWQHQDKLSAIASPASDVPAANDDYVALPAAVGDYEPASQFVPQIVDLSVLLPDRFGVTAEESV
ncbi:MAG: phage/plasmid replication protein, partial [Raoultibacter sp.]